MNTNNRTSSKPIKLHPCRTQYIINEMLLLLICPAIFLLSGFDANPIRKPTLIVALLLFLYLVYKYIYIRKILYIITDEQLIVKHGVLVAICDYIEFYRVIDYDEKSDFVQQLFGLKTVTIYSGDHSTPKLDMKGISVNTDIVSFIREKVEINKKAKGVYEITNR